MIVRLRSRSSLFEPVFEPFRKWCMQKLSFCIQFSHWTRSLVQGQWGTWYEQCPSGMLRLPEPEHYAMSITLWEAVFHDLTMPDLQRWARKAWSWPPSNCTRPKRPNLSDTQYTHWLYHPLQGCWPGENPIEAKTWCKLSPYQFVQAIFFIPYL